MTLVLQITIFTGPDRVSESNGMEIPTFSGWNFDLFIFFFEVTIPSFKEMVILLMTNGHSYKNKDG